MKGKITERSLYPELSKLLEANGFENISDIGVRHGYFDFECFYKSKRFIVEVKIGTGKYFKNLLRGITQAWGYCQDVKGDGILVIEYPAQVRTPLFIKPEIVKGIATETKVNAIVLSHFFNESFTSTKPSEVFSKLRFSIDDFLTTKETKTSFKLVVEALRAGISVISEILREQRTRKEISELIDTVVGRFDLFLGLGQIEKGKKATDELQLAAIDLIPYLLSNQILFYRIFSETTGKVDKLDENKITSIQSLKDYFKEITDINYKAIYSVDLATKLPEQEEIIEEVREIIKAINILKPEFVKHDLLGRLYHELLPRTTRKVLAAFYTNPVAADILAGLTIDKWNNTVIDPSCGSGTLLVAAYKRKLNLYKQERRVSSSSEIEGLHKKFVEQQITGIDIMPFASHLTAVNLAAQTPNAITNKVRVGCQDSLELQGRLCLPEFIERGTLIEPFQTRTQKALFGKGEVLERAGAIGLEGGKGEKFILKPVDVVLMNPPFSNRQKMPKWYREHLKEFQYLISKCGNRINFWGFFLALVDYLLAENGKMGLVIPINIARGEATKKIRNYILKNYHIQYILKTTKELAFSEGAAFRDILFIAEKRKPSREDLTGIVFLKKSIKGMGLNDAKRIIGKIKEIGPRKDYFYSNDDFEMNFIDYGELLKYENNLMPIIGGLNIQNRKKILSFIENLKIIAGNKLRPLDEGELLEGFHASPRGLSELVFIVNPSDKSRISRNVLLTLEKRGREHLVVNIKPLNKAIEIPINIISPALKTITSIRKFDVTKDCDYIISSDFKEFRMLLKLSRWKSSIFKWSDVQKRMENRQTFFAIAHRVNIYSKNTSHIATFNEEKMYTTHAFNVFPFADKTESKILTLCFNSIIGLSQLFSYAKETTGQYAEFMKKDLCLMKIVDVSKFLEREKQTLLSLFEKLRNVEFPSIIEQLENKFWGRVELDKTILKILGFSNKEINEWLPKIYDTLVEELRAMKEVK